VEQLRQRLHGIMEGFQAYETLIELTPQNGVWAEKGSVWEERRPKTNQLIASPDSVTYNAKGGMSQPSEKKGFHVNLTL
jgi:hypothetical protein